MLMQISGKIRIKELGLVIDDTLIIADIHLGYEESLRESGTLVAKRDVDDIIASIKSMIAGEKIKRIVINGDLKHEFGKISKSEWNDTLRLIDSLSEKAKIILIKGNHDILLEPVASKRNIKTAESLVIEDVLVVHGHKTAAIPKGIKTIVIGHQHPSITIGDGVRKERFKCFLKGKYKGHDLIVMPSFSDLSEGIDTKSEDLISPFIPKKDLKNFEVYIPADGKVMYFGKVGDLKEI